MIAPQLRWPIVIGLTGMPAVNAALLGCFEAEWLLVVPAVALASMPLPL